MKYMSFSINAQPEVICDIGIEKRESRQSWILLFFFFFFFSVALGKLNQTTLGSWEELNSGGVEVQRS